MLKARCFGCAVTAAMTAALLVIGCSSDKSADIPKPPSFEPVSSQPKPDETPPTASELPPGHPPMGDTAPATKLPPGHPPMGDSPPAVGKAIAKMPDVDTSGIKMSDAPVTLTGLSFSLPVGWVRENPGMNQSAPSMSRKAQFRLAKTDDEPQDAIVAITHFPRMKGPEMDRMNIARWTGQFSQPDGKRTEEVSTLTQWESGGVKVTLVDIPGTMTGGGGPMMGGGPAKKNFRMLAAIVDHPKGPHFIKVTGPANVVERYKASVVAFLKSAKVNEGSSG
jgi:hypothetical protein